jgi:DNA polymerase-1
LPSIPGVGEKTAAKWIVEYGSLVKLLEQADKVSGKVGDALRAHLDNVRRNRELTQLIHDAPIELSIDALAWNGVAASDLSALFEKLEFRTLKDRLKAIAVTEESSPAKSAEPELSLFAADIDSSVLTPAQISEKIAVHKGPIALAFEIHENSLHRYAVALSAQEAHLIHSAEMGSWATDSTVEKIAHGAKSLARINGLQGVVFDTELAAYLVNPGTRAQELQDLLDRWGSGAALDTSSAELTLLSSACALFALKSTLEHELESRGVGKLFYELELPIAQLLATMENRGIAVDKKALEKLLTFFEAEVARETKVAHTAAGHEFNVASPKQLQVVLFDELGLPKTKKIKTGFTTDADALTWLFEKTEHPVLAALLRIRETKKLATTIEGLLVEIAEDKRIHTHFAQTVAATGRLSSVGPNLQNIPVRTEEGRKIRDCFIAGDGYDALLTADYSQIEMRIMAHLSNDEGLLKAFESGEDLHATVAALVFGVKQADVDPEMRRQIKAMSYGLAYGLSSYGLAAQLDLTPPAAQDLMDRYFQRFGGIRDYLKTVVEDARKVGYTETVMGRRRYLPDLLHDNRQRREVAERMALNAPIQGSAADVIKQAMLNVQSALIAGKYKSRLLLQVHDELILEVVKSEIDAVSELVRTQMGSAYPLRAPLDVSVGLGKSWNEAAH